MIKDMFYWQILDFQSKELSVVILELIRFVDRMLTFPQK